jgi:organic radical activating enzyme
MIKQWPQCKHIVFTGGEPAMFQKHITTLKHNLPDYTFEIETNGSRNIEAGLFDVVNISYKLTSS